MNSSHQMRRSYLMGCCQIGHLLLASGIFRSFLPEANIKSLSTHIKEVEQFKLTAAKAPTWPSAMASNLAGGTLMRYLQFLLTVLVAMAVIGCGA